MTRLITGLLTGVGLAAIAVSASAQSFTNGSFESGTLNGWTLGGGYWYGGAYPVASDYVPGGANYDASGAVASVTTPGFDPRTDNNLRTVYAGNYSAMVNDANNNYSVSVLTQKVVGYTDPLIAFAYAAVLQDSHGPTDSDAFIITLSDDTTKETLFSYNLNSATAPGTFTQSSQNWFYTDWLTQSIDVSGRRGHDFTLSMLANDCPYGGHAGYAYLDGFGAVLGGGGTGGGPPAVPLLYWDGDAAGNAANLKIDGGDGIWTATKGNWTEQTGATNGAYNPNPGTVIFTGAPGTVTVDKSAGAIGVTGMQFLVDGYHITGDEIGLTGTSAIQVGDGSDAASGFTATIDSSLTGNGGLQKTDLGTLILTGQSSYTGPTEVAAGKLLVHGSIASSPVTVDSGAILGGHGTVGSVTALSGSTVSPGASIGTLSVIGNYSQASGSTLQNELQSTGETDKLAITGTATLDSGAILNVTKLDAPRYVLGTRYTVLSADGGVTGTYKLTGDTHVSYFIDLVDHYDPNHVYVDVAQTRSFASAGITPNEIAAGGGADTKTGPLYTAIAYLPDQASANAAFDQVSGEVHAAANAAFMEDSRFVRKAMTDRMTVPHNDGPDGKATWATLFNSRGHADSDGNAAAAGRDIAGGFVGWDMVKTPDWRVGLIGGYDHAEMKVRARNSTANADDFHFGVYGGTVGDGLGVRFGAAYTNRDVKTERTVMIPGFSDMLAGKYHGNIVQAFVDTGYRFASRRSTLEPFVSAAYVNADISGMKESGGAAALTLLKQNSHVTFETVGVRATHALITGPDGSLVLHGMAGLRHADGDVSPAASLAFQGGSSFTIDGLPLARNAVVFDAGIEGRIGPRTTIDLHYSGLSGTSKARAPLLASKFHDDGVFISLRYALGAVSRPAPQPAAYTPPPPPPAPMPQPAMTPAQPLPAAQPPAPRATQSRSFNVYFRFDSSAMTQDARAVIDQASSFIKAQTDPKVAVIGHTDTAGSAAYNLALSRKRAKAVASALVRQGVAAPDISADWQGEKGLAVPTRDGVANKANRRTEIDVHY
ncbi:MAG: autotransporter domain-containing protein [Asticcacaulis sp.]